MVRAFCRGFGRSDGVVVYGIRLNPHSQLIGQSELLFLGQKQFLLFSISALTRAVPHSEHAIIRSRASLREVDNVG